jgi:acyl-CoA thioesterase-1
MLRYGVHWARNKAAALVFAGWAGMAAAAETTVLALGDSLTQGYGLVAEEGFVPQLEAWLGDRGHAIDVINGGVSGDTSAGGLARVEWSLTPEVDAMIVALGGNDLLRGIDPEVTRSNIKGILQVAAANDLPVLLIGIQAPGNYGPDYKAQFDALFPDLAEDYDALYLDSFFAGLREPDGSMASPAEVMQRDGIHPNATGVARIVGTIGPMVESLIARAAQG